MAEAGVEVPKKELRKGIVGIDRRRKVLEGGARVRCARGCKRDVALVKAAKVRMMLEKAGIRIKSWSYLYRTYGKWMKLLTGRKEVRRKSRTSPLA